MFLLGALLLAQGSAAVPLLVLGLLLSLAAMPGWIELLLMWPDRVGGIAAVCGEAFRPYSRVLGNLAGTCYWWGWVPTCGLTALLSAAALHTWYLPGVPVTPLAVGIVVAFALLNLAGIRQVTGVALTVATGAATLAFCSVVVPVFAGRVDWHAATTYSLRSPFTGVFGSLTSAMAGFYLIGFAAPAFEAAGCHVGETINAHRNVPRAFYASAAMATLFFIAVPVVWLGVIGPRGLEGDLASALGPAFAPLFGGAARAAAAWLIVLNMFSGTLQPLAGASRTLSQLSEDGLLPRVLGRRSGRDVPWVATATTAAMSIVFLLLGDPIWMIAAANFTYLIGISLPSVAVFLLRRHSPDLPRPYRAPRGTIAIGLLAAVVWAIAAILGFQQFGLPTVLFGLGLSYSGAALYGLRTWHDSRRAGRVIRRSLHAKLTGAMLLVMTLDGTGYLIAVRFVDHAHPGLIAALEDIFVAVALITMSVGLVLPGMIAHTVTEVADAAERLANGTLAELTGAMERLAAGDLAGDPAPVSIAHVVVHSADELGAMAGSFNTMQDEVARAATALGGAREELRASRRHLEYLAETDPLTGVSNRRHFEEELEQAVAATAFGAASAALLVLDLDNFKYINDSHGHAVGDAVLFRIAVILRGNVRRGDLIGRLGGDEFAVLLRDVAAEQAQLIARTLLDEIRATAFDINDDEHLRLSVSIGVTTFDVGDVLTPAELLVNADIAMYDAKAAGRDRVAVATADAHRERAKSRQTQLQWLRDALDQQRLVLLAQPISDIRKRRVTQYELLLRIRSSNSGDLVPPGAFLEVAERSGMIREIDRWVVHRACQLMTEAHSAGRRLCLEVNVSGVSVSDADFLQLIEPDIARIAPYAADLVLELTETAAVVNLTHATNFATGLARLGCSLALDDFGAGFGSFYYLKHLPCAYLKIDGEFIRNLPTSPTDRVFVRAIVELAHGLGKRTIAEFVQDSETLAILHEFGVDYAQGYYVGHPEPLPKGAGSPMVPAQLAVPSQQQTLTVGGAPPDGSAGAR